MSDVRVAGLTVVRAEDEDRLAIADAYHQAFGFAHSRSDNYLDQVGLNNFHMLKVKGEVAAVMAVIETAHWFGGRPVPSVNIAHVAVNPAWRSAGLAVRFLEGVLSQAAAAGIGLATLFASTRPVYRRAGFSLAGLEIVYEAVTSALPRARAARFVRLQRDEVAAAIEPLYHQHCAVDAGALQHSPAHWASLVAGNPPVYLSMSEDAPGYVVIDTSDPNCLIVRDWVALNGTAATHILSLLSTFSSVYPRVRWHGSPQDALIFAMPDKGWRLAHQEEWLARVLDPSRVLQRRGYAADGSVGIDLVSPKTEVRLVLKVHDGQGICVPRTEDISAVRMDLSDFGTLVTGHHSARFLAHAGVMTGESAAIRMCDTLFAGPAPWVGEHF